METIVDVRAGANVSLLWLSMSHKVHQTGAAPKGMVSVGLIQPNRVGKWQGAETSSANLLSFGRSDPFDGVSMTGFRGTTLSVQQDYLEVLADQMGLDVPDCLRTSDVPEIRGPQQHLSTLRNLTGRLFASMSCKIGANDAETIASKLLLATNAIMFTDNHFGAKARTRALRKALDVMAVNDKENTPISRLCMEAGVSWSTLDRAFKDRFGFGPKQYQNRLRLNRVRSRLIAEPREAKIADIANEWGYWHLGQFARDYREMFGELPSATQLGARHIH